MRLIIVTFLILGFGFYQLSGGSDFEPADWRDVKAPEVMVDAITYDDPPMKQSAKPKVSVAADVTPFGEVSVPTTRRLVGAATQTPVSERTQLGPEQATAPLVAEANFVDVLPALYTDTSPDFRWVSASRVNMRAGPGTQFSVIRSLARHSEVEVLQDPGNGWVELHALETGDIGWMSANMLRK